MNIRNSFIGAITFLIGFTGCVGALRENTALLAAYAIFLAILLLLEMTAGILGFIFKDWVKTNLSYTFNRLQDTCCNLLNKEIVSNFKNKKYPFLD